MGFFRADDEAMQEIATRLGSVSEILQDESHGQLPAEAFGMPEAVGAVGDFISGWSHGRSEIVGGIQYAQEGLAGAGRIYQDTDAGIASKM